MDIRKLPASQGLAWFKQAIDLGSKNPRAVFGAAFLLIASLYAAVLLLAVIVVPLAGMAGVSADSQAGLGLAAMVMVLMMLLVMVLVPVLLGGLMHVIREAEAGRPVRARDLFVPFKSAHGRQLAQLGVVQLLIAVVGAILMVAVAGTDYWRDYLTAVQAAMQGGVPVVPQPDNAGLLFVLQLVFNYFSYAMTLFAIPLMLFSGANLIDALRDALRASVSNVGANLVAGLLFIGALVVAAIVVVLVAVLAGLIGGLVHPVVGSVLVLFVLFGFAAVVLVLVTGASYLAWRDTFGDTATPPVLPPAHGFEA